MSLGTATNTHSHTLPCKYTLSHTIHRHAASPGEPDCQYQVERTAPTMPQHAPAAGPSGAQLTHTNIHTSTRMQAADSKPAARTNTSHTHTHTHTRLFHIYSSVGFLSFLHLWKSLHLLNASFSCAVYEFYIQHRL